MRKQKLNRTNNLIKKNTFHSINVDKFQLFLFIRFFVFCFDNFKRISKLNNSFMFKNSQRQKIRYLNMLQYRKKSQNQTILNDI